MKFRVFVALVFLVLLMGGGYYIYQLYSTSEEPRFIAEVARTGTISETVLASGILKPSELVAVGAQVSGRITKLNVALGDEVKQGDLIAEIDSVTKQNDLKKSKAVLANIKAQKLGKQADLTNAQLVFKRQESLFSKKAVTEANLQSAEASVKAIEAQIAAIDAQIDEAQVEVQTAQANLDYTKITAPIDGTVLAIVNQEGRTVNANQSAPTIVILGQLDTMTVRVEISEADIVRVKPGQKVYFNILGEPDKQYEAVLQSIEPAPESITSDRAVTTTTSTSSSASSTSNAAVYYIGVFNVRNKDRKFRTYMTAEVKIVLAEAKNALLIPSSALGKRQKGGKYAVEVLGAGGVREPRDVTVGMNNKTNAEILSGLKEGEKVIVGVARNGDSTSSGNTRRPRIRF